MLPDCTGRADTHHRKRSFDLANDSPIVASFRRPVRHAQANTAAVINHQEPSYPGPSHKKRPFFPKHSNMPLEFSSIMSTHFPSFMTVVGEENLSTAKNMEEMPMPDTLQSDTQVLVTDVNTRLESPQHSSHLLHHRNSVTSMTTASTDSSPTTSNSTFDSPLMSDPSPSSSPESATSLPPPSPFRHLVVGSSKAQTSGHPQNTFPVPVILPDPSALSTIPVDTSKNVKNLSLTMSAVALPRPATAHGFEPSQAFSAPSSPLKDTPKTGRRKPANLTIMTPGFQQLTFARPLDVPLTPSSRPPLHHIQSSPALTALASPTKPPAQGLFLHLPASGNGHSVSSSTSSVSAQSINSKLPELKEEDEFHPPRSQETQEKGYPKGPILIYDSGVYLYLEPTAEEISQFDTVINVAKEIKPPFEVEAPKPEISEPKTAISEMSFKSAWEWPMSSEVPTPSTPKPSPFHQKHHPEYLHIAWDHNSEILEDLYCLCRIIDERVEAGKKVLIHCQLGVSRSASLVIAYGLYKGYQPDFHSMYMAVKQRSAWVGPNMSLIYQLTDFRSGVVQGHYSDHSCNPPPSWWKIRATSSPTMDTPVARRSSWVSTSQDSENTGTPVASKTSQSTSISKPKAPSRLDKVLPPVPLFPKEDERDAVANSVKVSQILGGPATQNPQEEKFEPTGIVETRSPPQSVSPRPLPFRERFDAGSPQPSPNRSKTPKLGILTCSPQMDLAMHDIPETPSLFSPRATEFMASPFGITVAGDLATSGRAKQPTKGSLRTRHLLGPISITADDQIPTPFDPRSPHQQGEAPEILRNIDEFL